MPASHSTKVALGHQLRVDVQLLLKTRSPLKATPGRRIHDLQQAAIEAPADDKVGYAAGVTGDDNGRQVLRKVERQVIARQKNLLRLQSQLHRQIFQRVDRCAINVGLAGLAQTSIADLHAKPIEQGGESRGPAVHARCLNDFRHQIGPVTLRPQLFTPSVNETVQHALQTSVSPMRGGFLPGIAGPGVVHATQPQPIVDARTGGKRPSRERFYHQPLGSLICSVAQPAAAESVMPATGAAPPPGPLAAPPVSPARYNGPWAMLPGGWSMGAIDLLFDIKGDSERLHQLVLGRCYRALADRPLVPRLPTRSAAGLGESVAPRDRPVFRDGAASAHTLVFDPQGKAFDLAILPGDASHGAGAPGRGRVLVEVKIDSPLSEDHVAGQLSRIGRRDHVLYLLLGYSAITAIAPPCASASSASVVTVAARSDRSRQLARCSRSDPRCSRSGASAARPQLGLSRTRDTRDLAVSYRDALLSLVARLHSFTGRLISDWGDGGYYGSL